MGPTGTNALTRDEHRRVLDMAEYKYIQLCTLILQLFTTVLTIDVVSSMKPFIRL